MERRSRDFCEYPTVPGLSRRSGISDKKIRAAIRRGELRSYRLGERWERVSWADFEKWMTIHVTRASLVPDEVRARVREIAARRRMRNGAPP